MKQSTPPFAWLGRYFEWVVLAGLLGLAAFFRFIDLTSLPPGLYTGEARIGLQALDLLHHGTLPGLDSYNQYAPLWVWLQALAVAVFGHNDWSLRVWPAVLGVLATGATWLWAKQWFTGRIAWIAALLVAVTPWSVTLSRSAMPTELIILLVPLTLWTVTEIYRRGTLGLWLAGAGLLTLSLLSGPLGWLLVASVTVLGVFQLVRRHELLRGGKARWAGLVAAALGFGLFGYLAGTSAASLSALPVALGLTAPPAIILENIARTLLMFNLRGDENFRHNFAAEPMLNAFVGLMFIFGILVSISRLHLRRYRILLLLFVILLAPAALSNTGVPNAAHAAAALPIVAVLAAVGISYMLELWYSTFPINSAARSVGQSVIVLLLALTIFQGYTQYFRAWAASGETYSTANEAATNAARFLKTTSFSGTRLVVATPDELATVHFLAYNQPAHQELDPAGLVGLPVTPGARQFIITAAARDAAAKNLALKFPGSKLRAHLSPFSYNEIYYVYEVTQ